MKPSPGSKKKTSSRSSRTSSRKKYKKATRRSRAKAKKAGATSFLIRGFLLLLFALLTGFVWLFCWGLLARSSIDDSKEPIIWLDVRVADSPELAEQLNEAGLVESVFLMEWYLRIMVPDAEVTLREHALLRGLTPRELSSRLTGDRGRTIETVTLREGLNSFEIGAILQKRGICRKVDFRKAVFDSPAIMKLGVVAPSAEGWLFPATYEFRADSSGATIVKLLVHEAQRRFKQIYQQGAGAKSSRSARYARLLGLQGMLTLASIVEKEASQQRAEVAQVFFNRLDNLRQETSGRLQSDPTAFYGCLLQPQLASCMGHKGKVTSRMLRDVTNLYNTYRHSGLPPGPISNPGEAAFSAVLAASEGEFLYFFADGKGNHLFSRNFSEHKRKIARSASR